MIKDRRYYDRLRLNLPVLIFKDGFEFSGVLCDISEGGMKIRLPKETITTTTFQEGETIVFQGVDNYINFAKQETFQEISGDGKILRADITEHSLYIGCQFCHCPVPLLHFITQKKTALFIDALK